ncbi:DNA polymerase III subunits gamma and tau [Fructilactobacillus florum 8D]|uniref:DNA-directed DNA polymerase n=1 Tax=Fructilactobacillus florum 8D TaxID=1221538 RepID=W9EDS3_9LACO|nr:DNA polymerase III subunit gamma/tau [Fructilactobacillus florum]ETO40283.1 DNA polymerase III subunits gamma and tau [Fructilactobacillus florum 8D]
MSYQALYRVWRPQRFDEIVGQPVITKTLKNALITKQISHAYLFSGPRGTGKTSTAKILAKAVNCPKQQDGEPCNQCPICLAINQGALNDVIEIDAASNNGVEEIRNIRDKAKYAPTEAAYKVYIIDEVHMLSTGAFNALLKTLEEPPAQVIFILATTEPHKLPATIISRVQRFSFKRISATAIVAQLEKILAAKQITYDDQGLKVIAQSAEGGLRDALSMLDQALAYQQDRVTYENALQVTGSVARVELQNYFVAVFGHEVATGLAMVQTILSQGKDAHQFIEDLIDYAQKMLLYQQDQTMIPANELAMLGERFPTMAQATDATVIYQAIEIMGQVQQQLRATYQPDVYLELLTVKLAHPKPNDLVAEVHQLQQQVTTLQQQLKPDLQKAKRDEQPATSTTATPAPRTTVSEKPRPLKADLTAIFQVLQTATRKALTNYQQHWEQLLGSLSVTQRAVMHVSKPVAASDQGVVVAFDYDFLYEKAGHDQELQTALQTGLEQVFGTTVPLLFVTQAEWPKIRQEYLDRKQPKQAIPTTEKTVETPLVTKAKDLFGSELIKIENN